MLAGQQIIPLMKINAFLSEFDPKYLQTSIALWVDGGSQETQYSVLSTRYSVHSVFSSWYSVFNTQEHCLAAVQCVVACCCCCCLFDHFWGVSFFSFPYFSNCSKNLLLEHRVWRIEHCYTILRGVTSAVGVQFAIERLTLRVGLRLQLRQII